MEMVKALVVYDISNNKRRNKCVKILNSYGMRVQLSVYEIYVSNNKYDKMIQSLKIFDQKGESVIIYRLNNLCNKTVYGLPVYNELIYQDDVFI